MYVIPRVLRGAFLVLALATGSAMLAAGQPIPNSGGCGTTESWDGNNDYECSYCEAYDSGYCVFQCNNGETGSFECDEF